MPPNLATVPTSHGSDALLYLVVATLMGLVVWVVRTYVSQIGPAFKEHTKVIQELPAAIGKALSDWTESAAAKQLQSHCCEHCPNVQSKKGNRESRPAA